MFAISVSQLNTYVHDRMCADPFLSEVWVEGEVGEVRERHSTAYITLMDNRAKVQCIVFGLRTSSMQDVLQQGQKVRVRGEVALYVPQGTFSIRIEEAHAAGSGDLLQQLLAVYRKLADAGYFAAERKRKLPPYPKEIAVITSKDGAALQDIRKIAHRRNPSVRLRLYPVTVQGNSAPQSIADAFAAANEDGTADIVIVARGGGSASDLAAFNDPRVVQAVVRSKAPVVSAVGHESDTSFCDMAADVRASTPSHAAELSVPEAAAIANDLRQMMQVAQRSVRSILERSWLRLRTELAGLRSNGIDARIRAAREHTSRLSEQGRTALQSRLSALRSELKAEEQKLSALNPASILSTGYAVVLRNGRRVYEASQLKEGDVLDLLFKDGSVRVTVDQQA